jgi:hypothetical protein
MTKERIILDSKHFMRIKHYRLKKKGKLQKKLTLETIYHKSLKSLRKAVKVIKGQSIQKCIRRLNQLKIDDCLDSSLSHEQRLQMLKQVDHIYVAQKIIDNFYMKNVKISRLTDHNLSFIKPLPNKSEEEELFINHNFINDHEMSKTGSLNKLKIILDETEDQIVEYIRNVELEEEKLRNKSASSSSSSTSHSNNSVINYIAFKIME